MKNLNLVELNEKNFEFVNDSYNQLIDNFRESFSKNLCDDCNCDDCGYDGCDDGNAD